MSESNVEPVEQVIEVDGMRVEGATITIGCACGCGLSPKSARSSFLQGHDARLLGQVKRGEKGRDMLAQFPILLAKLDNNLASRPKTRREPRAASTKAETKTQSMVKIGRWEYPVVASAPTGNGELAVTYKNRQHQEITVIVPKAAVR